MLLFGHRFIPSISFYHVLDIDSITNTPSSSVIHVEFSQNNLDIINHAKVNQIALSICCQTITEIIYASSLDASFIVVKSDLAEKANKIANDYLFDAKILVLIEEESEIESLALLGVDGIIFSNAIIKINS
ncbi:MAG: hypothetical protein ACI9TV_000058 [Sulfurimonas sp.]|jgi:hypothetical protein|uniref:hypothetical protein n=1 Tax=Sulfurimonas sp. TaxID=2022749 RepID=UPI0039E3EDFF